MRSYLLWTFLALHSVVQAAQPVSIEAEPLYQALPFCARDCIWNDDNDGDIASNITFFFPCSNSCYCNPDTIEDALSYLSQCIISSPCCDMTDYVNAVSLYYSYCNSHEPWSMPVPSEIGTAPPSTTSRTTSLSTASWCSTAQFSPTSSTSTASQSTSMSSTRALTATATAAASSSDDDGDDDDDTPNPELLSILLPTLTVGVTLVILVFCAWISCHIQRKAKRRIKTAFSRLQPDSTPLIIIPHEPSPRPSSVWSAADHIEAADQTGDENDLGAGGGKDASVPPPYSP
jgi:hypothetical protein